MKKNVKLNVIYGTTCFSEHEKYNVRCLKTNCRLWINDPNSNNCTILAAKKGPVKQEIVGNLFNLTRMRVCQIERNIINKVKYLLNRR